jgi:hypothetical protein
MGHHSPTTAASLTAPQRQLRQSAWALVLGFLAVVVLSLGTDQVLHVLKVYPPWGEPMRDPRLNLLALSYRIIYGIVGGYIPAHFAPRNPMRHAMIAGLVGFVLSGLGLMATLPLDLGPAWYPIALWLTALPCAWVGGALHSRLARRAPANLRPAGAVS